MKRILLRVATAWTVATLTALIPLALYCVWTPGYMDEDPNQYRIVLTWVWTGLIPSLVLLLATYACFYGLP